MAHFGLFIWQTSTKWMLSILPKQSPIGSLSTHNAWWCLIYTRTMCNIVFSFFLHLTIDYVGVCLFSISYLPYKSLFFCHRKILFSTFHLCCGRLFVCFTSYIWVYTFWHSIFLRLLEQCWENNILDLLSNIIRGKSNIVLICLN